MEKIKVPAILGPTAVGKSELAFEFAKAHGYEILSCDSRQIYKGMDIGTAKPTPNEQASVKHHLIDILDPSRSYSAFAFAADALRIIREAHSSRKKILICGGAGLYYQILSNGGNEIGAANLELRETLLQEAREHGSAALHARLQSLNPQAAKNIHPNNLHRTLRALDVYYQKGSTEPQTENNAPQDIDFAPVIIERPREELYGRINSRVDVMFEAGLYDEFLKLIKAGYTAADPGMLSVGYRELFDVLNGGVTIERAKELIKQNSRHYAKRQLTWFRNKLNCAHINADEFKNRFERGINNLTG